jgi:hypothetical protein
MDKDSSRFQAPPTITSVEKAMRAHGKKIRCQDMDSISMPMELSIVGNGNKISIMERESINFLMGLAILGNGKIILCMVQATISTSRVTNGMESFDLGSMNPNFKRNLLRKDKSLFEKQA